MLFILPAFSDVRIEEFFYEKLDKKVPTRMNNHELLGESMIDSGNESGPGTAYGKYQTHRQHIVDNTIVPHSIIVVH